MAKQLKLAGAMAMLALCGAAALPAGAQSPFPSSAVEFSSHVWSERMMKAMDANRDGRVSRQEYLTYMGAQFDTMDTGRTGALTAQQFTDRRMMARTFTFPASPNESGSGR